MAKILFVGGVHGVGKTYCCKELASRYDLIHRSASQLISAKMTIFFNSSKRVGQISENQEYLIEAIDELNLKESSLLLDGHFCLLDQSGEIVRLPEETYFNLSPAAIILIIDHAESISGKLFKRDQIQAFSIELIETFQENEIKYAKDIAAKHQIPLYIHSVNENNEELHSFVENMLKVN
ncbi:hypothetical protein PAT3040_04989 [Paenibacillus agaridevorans]|uniref:Adenylate kinase n=1 Tax=Paenibacillus agaridevorans TaxID=171404 RepID=A0A2R5EUN6_9BACL|nr:ATP-binding protein [Paenibacillus agaridevorans]GBG10267.1 hypothetical protein PAT3040_04989 [Paenibacillus agaridevorans]